MSLLVTQIGTDWELRLLLLLLTGWTGKSVVSVVQVVGRAAGDGMVLPAQYIICLKCLYVHDQLGVWVRQHHLRLDCATRATLQGSDYLPRRAQPNEGTMLLDAFEKQPGTAPNIQQRFPNAKLKLTPTAVGVAACDGFIRLLHLPPFLACVTVSRALPPGVMCIGWYLALVGCSSSQTMSAAFCSFPCRTAVYMHHNH